MKLERIAVSIAVILAACVLVFEFWFIVEVAATAIESLN